MIIYNAKTDKVPLNTKEWNGYRNYCKLKNYNINLFEQRGEYLYIKEWKVVSDVYFTYTTLVEFNTNLSNGYSEDAFQKLRQKLSDNSDVLNSIDYKCIRYYEKMSFWCRLFESKPSEETYKRICNEIQKLLEDLKKQGIVKESKCNVKRNYYL